MTTPDRPLFLRSARWLAIPLGALVIAAGLFVTIERREPARPIEARAACATGTACAAPIAREADGEAVAEVPRGKPRLLEFESEHCAACKRMAPVVKDVETRCAKDRDTIVRVTIDDPRGEALAARYGVRMLPTFLNVDALGEEVTRSVGEQPKAQIARMLSEVRGEACSTAL